jgi:multicomponent Na+:H+ antiporter subunit B
LKVLNFLVVFITGAILIYGTLDMPDWADPHSPASTHVSNYYIEKAEEETATPNMVTAVLADYRGYDTLGETTVIFTAGICCILILRKKRKAKNPRGKDD